MRRLLAALLALLLAAPAGARGFAGARPFELLFLDAGAAQAALGGAFGAGADDPNVLDYNPAGLTTLEQTRAAFMHNAHFQSVSREHMALGGPGWGATVDYLRYGDIQRRTLSNPDGTGLGSFSPTAMSAAAGLAVPLSDSLSVGAAVRDTRETLDGTTGAAISADVGLQTVLLEDPLLRAGVAVQNAGPRVRFQSASESLPLNVRWGAALASEFLGRPFSLLADANHDETGRLVLQAGLSVPVGGAAALRVGYNGRNDAGPGITGGLGLRWGPLSIDYAFVPYGPLGSSQQLSLGWAFGRPSVRPELYPSR
ncbi:MAG: PorV/PorQ family protein [Elusimicrobia bacterium]|nr:PorV/PorQ family protein [Elusimicrobiota bacterium]